MDDLQERMRIHTDSAQLKHAYHDGLDELDAIFAHNTRDNGRPPMTEDGIRTYRLDGRKAQFSAQTRRLEIVAIVQHHSALSDGVYAFEPLEAPAGVVDLIHVRCGETTAVARLRPATKDFWVTPPKRALHRGIVDALEDHGWQSFGVMSGLDEPQCPECGGDGCTRHDIVDLVGDKAHACTIIGLCDVCGGQGGVAMIWLRLREATVGKVTVGLGAGTTMKVVGNRLIINVPLPGDYQAHEFKQYFESHASADRAAFEVQKIMRDGDGIIDLTSFEPGRPNH